MVTADEAIGVGIDAGGGADGAPLDDDGHAARQACGVVAERDGLADQGGVDLEGDAMEADRAVVLHLALLLEEKELGEILRGQGDVVGGAGPLLAGRRVLQAAVRRVEVLVLNPRPEALIERVERPGVGLEQRGQELEANRPKPPFQFSLPLWRKRSGVDEGHAQLGAHEREVTGAIRTAVIHVQTFRNAAAEDRAFEDGQEGGHRFAAREGRVRNHPGRIVEQRDEVRLVPPAVLGVEHRRPVHDVAHPELVGGVVTEAAPVFARGCVGRTRHQAVTTKQAVDGRRREGHVGGHARLGAGGGNDERDAVGRVRLFQRAELVGDGARACP